jgi:hypothetical protein
LKEEQFIDPKDVIVPDKNGKFHPKSELYHDNIPDVFKTPIFESFGIPIKSKLLHQGITSIQLQPQFSINNIIHCINQIYSEIQESHEKNERDFVQSRQNYDSRNYYPYSSYYYRSLEEIQSAYQQSKQNLESKKITFSFYIIYILPKEDCNLWIKNFIFLNFVKKFFKNPQNIVDEITIPYDSKEIWEKAFQIVFNKLILTIEQNKSTDQLSGYFERSIPSTINFLNEFYSFCHRYFSSMVIQKFILIIMSIFIICPIYLN